VAIDAIYASFPPIFEGNANTNPLNASFASEYSIYNKFQIRQVKRHKEVYVGTGLFSIWSAINTLSAFLGTPSTPGPSIADWSVRNDIAPAAGVTQSDGSVHLLDVMKLLQNAPPMDVLRTSWTSLRSLLNV
jgi:hypothetical protein